MATEHGEALRDELRGADATLELGRRLGRACPGAAVLCLRGHLGAGKTTLVKGLAEGLGVARADEVPSPTFLRLVRYEASDGPDLVHVDAYRLSTEDEVFELGLAEDLEGGAIVALEWPGNIESSLPADRLEIELEHRGPAARGLLVRATGPVSAAWLANLLRREPT